LAPDFGQNWVRVLGKWWLPFWPKLVALLDQVLGLFKSRNVSGIDPVARDGNIPGGNAPFGRGKTFREGSGFNALPDSDAISCQNLSQNVVSF